MTKKFVLGLIPYMLLLLSCGDGESQSPEETMAEAAAAPAMAAMPMASNSFVHLTTYNAATMTTYEPAAFFIRNYIASTNLNRTTNVFEIGVDDNLRQYVRDSNLTYMHFVLAEDTGVNAQLRMYISAADTNGNHVYLFDTSTNKHYALQCTSFMISAQMPPGGAAEIIVGPSQTIYDHNMIPYLTAKELVSKYTTRINTPGTVKNTTAYSYTLAAKVFDSLINAIPAVAKVRFYLAEIDGTGGAKYLTLVMTPLTNAGGIIYLKKGARNYAMEYFNPCPRCMDRIVSGTIEPGTDPFQFEEPGQQQAASIPIIYKTDLNTKSNLDAAYQLR